MIKATIESASGPVEIDATAFRPDYTTRWTAVESVRMIGNGFAFRGEGWYLGKLTSLLVIPTNIIRDDEQVFLFCMYNHTQAGHAINWVANAPVRDDQR